MSAPKSKSGTKVGNNWRVSNATHPFMSEVSIEISPITPVILETSRSKESFKPLTFRYNDSLPSLSNKSKLVT